MVTRVKSGITGLDPLIEGGFVDGTINLVTGKTGTSKTILCSQFLNYGASQLGQKGLYITSEETRNNIVKSMKQFGWDFDALESKKMLKILEVQPFEAKVIISKITEAIESMKVKRLVIDSVSMFEYSLEEQHRIRKFLYTLFQKLREMNILTVVTSEIPEEVNRLSQFGAVEFMADAVIKLQYMELADTRRSLMIRKMRMTNHSPNIHPFEITKTGLKILSV